MKGKKLSLYINGHAGMSKRHGMYIESRNSNSFPFNKADKVTKVPTLIGKRVTKDSISRDNEVTGLST